MQSPRSVSVIILQTLLPRRYMRRRSASVDLLSSYEVEKAIAGLGYVPQKKASLVPTRSMLASAVFAVVSTAAALKADGVDLRQHLGVF